MSSITTILIGTHLQASGKPDDVLKVYWLYFGVSLLIPTFAMFLPETRMTSKKRKTSMVSQSHQSLPIKTIFYLSFETLCRKSIFYPVLFTFILSITPTSSEPLNYYFVNTLGFTPQQIGYLGIIASCAFLAAIGYVALQSRKSNDNFRLCLMYSYV